MSADLPDLPRLPWRCTLPLPPSINQAKAVGYTFVKGGGRQARIRKTDELTAWEVAAGAVLDRQRPPRLLAALPLLFVFRFWMPSLASDWDGRVKYAQDLVASRLGRPLPGDRPALRTIGRGARKGQTEVVLPATFNDRDVINAIVDKKVDRADPRLELTIRWGHPHLIDWIEFYLDDLPTTEWGTLADLPALGNRVLLERALGETPGDGGMP